MLNTETNSVTISNSLTLKIDNTFNRLILSGTNAHTITISPTKTLTLTNLTDTNLNGTVGALTQWRSSTTGSSYNVTIPEPITLTFQNPQDCTISQIVTANDGTSVDGGNNNVNWIWPSLAKQFYLTYLLLKRMSAL